MNSSEKVLFKQLLEEIDLNYGKKGCGFLIKGNAYRVVKILKELKKGCINTKKGDKE